MIKLKDILNESISSDSVFRQEIKDIEGDPPKDSNGNYKTFDDGFGNLTIGWGHTGKYATPGNTLTKTEAEQLLTKDIDNKEKVAKNKFAKYDTFSLNVQRSIINALFRGDLGPKASALINTDPVDWNAVADEYLNSAEFEREKNKTMQRRTASKLAQPDTNIYTRMTKNADRFRKGNEKGAKHTPNIKIPGGALWLSDLTN